MLNQISNHRRGIGVVVLVKLLLIAGVLATLQLGSSLLTAGVAVLVLHAVAAATLVGLLIFGGRRHGRSFLGGLARSSSNGSGIVLHGAAGYDLLVRVLTFGREKELRERMLAQAKLQPGEAVLDAACGTGTLAICAKREVGVEGQVVGIDASPGMVERAKMKAERTGLDVTFVNGGAQLLPFDDGQFDIVMGTLMLHHLPKPLRREFVREARRVLKPGGRLMLIDFDRSHRQSGFRLHRHGDVDRRSVVEMLEGSGFALSDVGELGMKDLIYFVAKPTI